MINLQNEKALTAGVLAKLPQLQRNGRSPHVSQIHRWWSAGLKGHRLESIVVGGTRCSTSEAVDRWIAALSGQPVIDQTRTPIRRQRDHDRAEKSLEAAGY